MRLRCWDEAKGKREKAKPRQNHLRGVDCLALTMIDTQCQFAISSCSASLAQRGARLAGTIARRSEAGANPLGARRVSTSGTAVITIRRCGGIVPAVLSATMQAGQHYLLHSWSTSASGWFPLGPYTIALIANGVTLASESSSLVPSRHLSDGNHRLQFWLNPAELG